MPNRLFRFLPLLALVLLLSACGGSTSSDNPSEGKTNDNAKQQDSRHGPNDKATRTYQSENGPIKVPTHPKRVVVLNGMNGDVAALGINVVGVGEFAKKSPVLKSIFKDAEVVSDQNIEKVIRLNPDLIIGASDTKNVKKLKRIAPTVTYTYGKLGYLQEFIEVGKLLNKEQNAKNWVKDFKQRAKDIGKKTKSKFGEDMTVTVLEKYDKEFSIFGDNWGRGTEVLYQAMGLKMPKEVKNATQKEGYLTLSPEVIPKYVGDFLILSAQPGAKNSFQKTETYKNIPAVKKGNVIVVNDYAFLFNDPLSLDYELNVFKKAFVGK